MRISILEQMCFFSVDGLVLQYIFGAKKVRDGKSGTQAMVCTMRQLIRLVHSMMRNKSEWKERAI